MKQINIDSGRGRGADGGLVRLDRARNVGTSGPSNSLRQNSIAQEPEEVSAPLFLEYYRTVLRHRRLILSLAAAGMLVGALLHLTTEPVYRTRTSLDIQTLNGDFMNQRNTDPTGTAYSGETNLQTQIKLLQSDTLMENVRARLTAEPHPATVERMDLLSRMQRLIHVGGNNSISFNDLLEDTAKNLKVKPLGITRLVEVTCDSWDPSFAAQFCNELTSEYQSEDLESRGASAKRTSDWLMRQAADVRQKAQDSEARLEAATGGNGLMLSQESTNTVGEDRLRQMQAELVRAQADRIQKEAEAQIAKTAVVGAEPAVLRSAAYLAAQQKLADLQNRVAELVPPLTEENPKVIHLRNEIKSVQKSMDSERVQSGQRLDNEFAAAKHRENLLAMAYHRQESSVSSDMEKGSHVALLRREVESEQQLYQTLLQRAKEAGFASAMQAATIRVVDAARKPNLAVFPQRLTTITVCLIIGSLLGFVVAFFKDRNKLVFRVPGDSQRFLDLDEIGVIPSLHMVERKGLPNASGAMMQKSTSIVPSEHPALSSTGWGDNFSIVAEAYRNAMLSLALSRDPNKTRVYVVSSPNAGEGKTTVTSNLGVALSKSKLRIVLVDGDLRRPNLHRALSVSNSVGLRDVLKGHVDLSQASTLEFCKPTAYPDLFVVSAGSGSGDPAELLHSNYFEAMLVRLAEDFDMILVDTPPMLHMADARILARQSNGAILIFRAGTTTREQAMNARDLLDHDRVRVVGTILNDFDPAKEGRTDYYKSYYQYQNGAESGRAAVNS